MYWQYSANMEKHCRCCYMSHFMVKGYKCMTTVVEIRSVCFLNVCSYIILHPKKSTKIHVPQEWRTIFFCIFSSRPHRRWWWRELWKWAPSVCPSVRHTLLVNVITWERNELGSPNWFHECISWKTRTKFVYGSPWPTFQGHRGQHRKLPETACERDNLRTQWARITKLGPQMHLLKTLHGFVNHLDLVSRSQRCQHWKVLWVNYQAYINIFWQTPGGDMFFY